MILVKEASLIAAVKPYVQRLSTSDLYLSAALIATVLELAGED
jgi:predicted nucleic acid-binding protein